ncbi:MAG: hypothetical protein GY856_13130 [bacterium]|nr:hypothetical protein [bacterium]
MDASARIPSRRWLFVLWDGGGNVPPVLLLARALLGRGHQVRILSNPSPEERITATGAGFVPYRRAPFHDPRSPETDAVQVWKGRTSLDLSRRLRDRLMFGPATGFAADVRCQIADFSTDAVAADYILFGAHAAVEASGRPSVVVMDSIYPLPSGRRPGPFPFMFDRLIARGLPTFNRLREDLGLDRLAATRDQYERADRLFVMTFRSFDPAGSRLPANLRHVGPQFATPDEDAHPGDGPPRVLVGLSTVFQGQDILLRRLIRVLSGLPVRALVTLGPTIPAEALEPGSNVELRRFLPHENVLPKTSVVVTHGGHGTTIRSLAHGVPLLGLPFGQDQFDNVRRVVNAGAGLELSRDAPASELRRALIELLKNPASRRGAQAMAARFRSEDDPLAVVRELEDLAEAAAGGSRS